MHTMASGWSGLVEDQESVSDTLFAAPVTRTWSRRTPPSVPRTTTSGLILPRSSAVSAFTRPLHIQTVVVLCLGRQGTEGKAAGK